MVLGPLKNSIFTGLETILGGAAVIKAVLNTAIYSQYELTIYTPNNYS